MMRTVVFNIRLDTSDVEEALAAARAGLEELLYLQRRSSPPPIVKPICARCGVGYYSHVDHMHETLVLEQGACPFRDCRDYIPPLQEFSVLEVCQRCNDTREVTCWGYACGRQACQMDIRCPVCDEEDI